MAMTRRRLLQLTAAAAAGAAVAPAAWALLAPSPSEEGPPTIRYGRDRCDRCGMLISDRRFSAGAREGAAVTRYDDIGCLAVHRGAALASGRATGFVRDAVSEAWLEAGRAAFVRSPRIRTPMSSGIAAYADPAAARAAFPGAAVLTLRDLVARQVEERS